MRIMQLFTGSWALGQMLGVVALVAPPPIVAQTLEGAIDMHIHSEPDDEPGGGIVLQLGRIAR